MTSQHGPVGMVGVGNMGGELAAKGTRFLDAGISGGVPTLVGPGTPTAFQVSSALGYGDVISNRVVDAYGDLAGGVRVTDAGPDQASTSEAGQGEKED